VLARHLQAAGATHLHNHFADSSANVAMLTAALADIGFSYTLHGPAEIYDPLGLALRAKRPRRRASSSASAISPGPRRCCSPTPPIGPS
jgi:hypothetical protein